MKITNIHRDLAKVLLMCINNVVIKRHNNAIIFSLFKNENVPLNITRGINNVVVIVVVTTIRLVIVATTFSNIFNILTPLNSHIFQCRFLINA